MFETIKGRTEAAARNGYTANVLDRRSKARGAESLAEALGHADAAFYLFIDEDVLLAEGPNGLNPLFPAAAALQANLVAGATLLLGWLPGGAPRLAGIVEDTNMPAGLARIDLRSLAAGNLIGQTHLGALAQAKSLMHWHATHRFCGACGEATHMAAGGFRRECPGCARVHFPRTDPVVIMLVLDGESCLLARQPRFAPDMFSALAGFVEPGETIEDAARREVGEEAGLAIGAVRYHSSQPWPFPASLMLGCHCEAGSRLLTLDTRELEEARWFDRDEAASLLVRDHGAGLFAPPPMAIAHQLIRAFVEAGSDVLRAP